MINVLKRLAELDAKNPNIVKESQVDECGMMPEMLGGSAPSVPASFSINATAGSSDEVSSMLQDIMALAGVKSAGGDGLGAELDGELGGDPLAGPATVDAGPVDAGSSMRSVIDKLNPADGEPDGGDAPEGDDDKEEVDEYDNTPADPTDTNTFGANDFAKQQNTPGQGDRMDGTMPKGNPGTLESITHDLFKEYASFVNEAK